MVPPSTMPALLIKMSRRPNCSKVLLIICDAVSGSAISPCMKMLLKPFCVSCSVTALAELLTELQTTNAPSSQKRRAVAAPIPAPAPVTITILFLKRIFSPY